MQRLDQLPYGELVRSFWGEVSVADEGFLSYLPATATTPPTRLRRATSPYTGEALGKGEKSLI